MNTPTLQRRGSTLSFYSAGGPRFILAPEKFPDILRFDVGRTEWKLSLKEFPNAYLSKEPFKYIISPILAFFLEKKKKLRK